MFRTQKEQDEYFRQMDGVLEQFDVVIGLIEDRKKSLADYRVQSSAKSATATDDSVGKKEQKSQLAKER